MQPIIQYLFPSSHAPCSGGGGHKQFFPQAGYLAYTPQRKAPSEPKGACERGGMGRRERSRLEQASKRSGENLESPGPEEERKSCGEQRQIVKTIVFILLGLAIFDCFVFFVVVGGGGSHVELVFF